jgi:guanylate kinase
MSDERRRRGLLFVLSGPSGVGKDTVLNRIKARGLPVYFVITCTTRAPRPGEAHGVNYYFSDPEEFERMCERGDLLEWAVVHGNHYGTPRLQVREALASGRDALLKIDVQGAAKVRAQVPEAILIFLAPPSAGELVERLEARGTETAHERAIRLADAEREMGELPKFDYVVVNHHDQVEQTVDQIVAIITAEHSRVHPRRVEV